MASLDSSFASQDLERLHEGDPRWQLVLRIAASPVFRRAARVREFLVYVCDHAIRGEAAELTEQHIGIEVFKRPQTYSTTEDNVVRAQARQVRVKLGEYFAEYGPTESLTLEIPKGSYVPIFAPKIEPAAQSFLPASEPAPARALARRFSLTAMAWALFALCLVALILVLWNDRAVRTQAAASEDGAALLPPLSWLFQNRQPVTIVVADSGFGLYQDLIGRPATLDEYVNPQFFAANPPQTKNKELGAFSKRLATRQFTSFADLALSQQLLSLLLTRHEKASIRFARDLHLRELATGNFVLIGSPYSNPWVSLFAKRRNFLTTFEPQSRRGLVLNGQPRPGELKQFEMKGEDGLTGSTFGVLAFLAADAESGNVLLLDGLNMEGTEAAGSFLTERHATLNLMKRVGLKPESEKRDFEVVVETKAIAGTTRDSAIAAFRVGAAGK